MLDRYLSAAAVTFAASGAVVPLPDDGSGAPNEPSPEEPLVSEQPTGQHQQGESHHRASTKRVLPEKGEWRNLLRPRSHPSPPSAQPVSREPTWSGSTQGPAHIRPSSTRRARRPGTTTQRRVLGHLARSLIPVISTFPAHWGSAACIVIPQSRTCDPRQFCLHFRWALQRSTDCHSAPRDAVRESREAAPYDRAPIASVTIGAVAAASFWEIETFVWCYPPAPTAAPPRMSRGRPSMKPLGSSLPHLAPRR